MASLYYNLSFQCKDLTESNLSKHLTFRLYPHYSLVCQRFKKQIQEFEGKNLSFSPKKHAWIYDSNLLIIHNFITDSLSFYWILRWSYGNVLHRQLFTILLFWSRRRNSWLWGVSTYYRNKIQEQYSKY